MNCTTCSEILDDYLAGTLKPELSAQLVQHLNHCQRCNDLHQMLTYTQKLIKEEKNYSENPFLTERIMAQIEHQHSDYSDNRLILQVYKVARPALIAASVILAVFIGIAAGNLTVKLTKPNLPAELIFINDDEIEATYTYLND